ncbi:DUF4340 domain-containing protein [Lignipirellula cremea]|uniref:DUF4340 domain-containing protein n=1 Tax=Lignipirellula cremea TaxID=2528010 RepID=A0A518E3S3_9BACT|nr:DUF4340 domain-containing protein [Lignipirellula cremea]QDU98745.1 hypothetical protein Pla8534_66180 [Lignipirellula cremea]
MTESMKTLLYVSTAAVVMSCVGIVVWRQTPAAEQVEEMVGKPLFTDLKDPLDAASLEIVRYDSQLGQIKPFRVAQVGGRWVIPSQSNYPADAESRLRGIATELMSVKVLGVASDLPSDHEQYGVVKPDQNNLKTSADSLGVLVRLEDKKGKPLAGMIVGRAVDSTDDASPAARLQAAGSQQRYVRLLGQDGQGQDRVFVASVDLDQFSSRFEDWIQTDLLEFSPIALDQISIREYAVTPVNQLQVKLTERSEITVREKDAQWELVSLSLYGDNGWEKGSLPPGQQINAERLNELKDAIKDLTIVGVQRKPALLSDELKGSQSQMTIDAAGKQGLERAGFWLIEGRIVSNNGELVIRMNTGFSYRLRFGRSASLGDEENAGINRYVFAVAELDEQQFPAPAKPELPALPGAEKTDDDKTDGEKQPSAAADADRRAEIEAERKRLLTEYELVFKQWQAKRRQAEIQVRNLNARFADWFFIVPEQTFQKLHLGRDDLFALADTAPSTPRFGPGSGILAPPPPPQSTTPEAPPAPPADKSKVDEPKVDEPKAVEPKADEPKADEPKADEPKANEPKADEPKANEPKSDEPPGDS